MDNINLVKLKDLHLRHSLVKKAYDVETDFRIKEGLKKILDNLAAHIKSEVGAHMLEVDKE